VLGVVLIVYFAGGTFVQWFPLRASLRPIGISSSSRKIGDYFWHITLPCLRWWSADFAVITILVKNSVLEEIRKQYVLLPARKAWREGRGAVGGMFSQRHDSDHDGISRGVCPVRSSAARCSSRRCFPSTDWDCFL